MILVPYIRVLVGCFFLLNFILNLFNYGIDELPKEVKNLECLSIIITGLFTVTFVTYLLVQAQYELKGKSCNVWSIRLFAIIFMSFNIIMGLFLLKSENLVTIILSYFIVVSLAFLLFRDMKLMIAKEVH